MKHRVIRKNDSGHWEIRTTTFEITPRDERNKLKEFFDEIRMNYRLAHGDILIDGTLVWSDFDDHMLHFYDDWAQFTPF